MLKNNFLFFTGVLLICFFVSAWFRYQQFETWKETPAAFFVGERPMMTTLDAPYWLRGAREYNEETYGQNDSLRDYPSGTESFKKNNVPKKFKDPTSTSSTSSTSSLTTSSFGTSLINYRDVPLLSFLVAHITQFFNYNYYLTGTLLIPVLASLFILPLGFIFFIIGIPVSGLLGGLIGTFAGGYYMRSSIGRIDTDMLNLFFPLITGLFILFASRAKSERSLFIYSIGTGLSLFLFNWWYNRPGFTLVFFVIFIFILFIHQIRFRGILLGAFLFVLCVNPVIFLSGASSVEKFLKNYITIEESRVELTDKGTSAATFPNTMKTISEVENVSMDEVFRRVLSNPLIGWIGFLTFLLLALLRWRVLLTLAPMLVLALLSFQSSNRFIMYLGPFIGIGLGWLLCLAIEGLFVFWPRNHAESTAKKLKGTKWERNKVKIISWLRIEDENSVKNGLTDKSTMGKDIQSFKDIEIQGFKRWNWVRQGALYLVMGVSFLVISSQTAISFVPGPSIHTKLYATFFEVKKRVPKDSVLLTWWDYGYAITDATGLATFHDGGSQMSPKTYFTARGLISSDPDELFYITQYLATEGNRGISENNTSPKALLEALENPQYKPLDPIYLFFTADMTGKYGAISKLGSWDLANGNSKPKVYQNLSCNKITSVEINCRGATIDLKAGKINNQVPLRRLVFIRDGQVLREQTFVNKQGFTLQLLVVGRQIMGVQLIDEDIFRSNYNQMFLLGRYRKDLFEEIYRELPFSRLYRFKY